MRESRKGKRARRGRSRKKERKIVEGDWRKCRKGRGCALTGV